MSATLPSAPDFRRTSVPMIVVTLRNFTVVRVVSFWRTSCPTVVVPQATSRASPSPAVNTFRITFPFSRNGSAARPGLPDTPERTARRSIENACNIGAGVRVGARDSPRQARRGLLRVGRISNPSVWCCTSQEDGLEIRPTTPSTARSRFTPPRRPLPVAVIRPAVVVALAPVVVPVPVPCVPPQERIRDVGPRSVVQLVHPEAHLARRRLAPGQVQGEPPHEARRRPAGPDVIFV